MSTPRLRILVLAPLFVAPLTLGAPPDPDLDATSLILYAQRP